MQTFECFPGALEMNYFSRGSILIAYEAQSKTDVPVHICSGDP